MSCIYPFSTSILPELKRQLPLRPTHPIPITDIQKLFDQILPEFFCSQRENSSSNEIQTGLFKTLIDWTHSLKDPVQQAEAAIITEEIFKKSFNSIDFLPLELVHLVLEGVPGEDLLTLAASSKKWSRWIQSSPTLYCRWIAAHMQALHPSLSIQFKDMHLSVEIHTDQDLDTLIESGYLNYFTDIALFNISAPKLTAFLQELNTHPHALTTLLIGYPQIDSSAHEELLKFVSAEKENALDLYFYGPIQEHSNEESLIDAAHLDGPIVWEHVHMDRETTDPDRFFHNVETDSPESLIESFLFLPRDTQIDILRNLAHARNLPYPQETALEYAWNFLQENPSHPSVQAAARAILSEPYF